MLVTSTTDGLHSSPAGQVTRTIVPAGKRTDGTGRVYRLQAFQFDAAVCWVCPLRSQCIATKGRKGRRVLIHPQGVLLLQARALQQSAAYDEYRARRVVAEHRPARLVQLGIRQSHYFGRVKTKFQVYLAATVTNLTLELGKIGLSGSTGGGAEGHRVVLNDVRAVVANAAANFSVVRLRQLWPLILFVSGFTAATPLPNQGFPARFRGMVILLPMRFHRSSWRRHASRTSHLLTLRASAASDTVKALLSRVIRLAPIHGSCLLIAGLSIRWGGLRRVANCSQISGF